MSDEETTIYIDAEVKKQANELFSELRLDMSTAINIFLRQCIMRQGLPFKVKIPEYSEKLLDAADVAERIARDNNVPAYTSIEDLNKALED